MDADGRHENPGLETKSLLLTETAVTSTSLGLGPQAPGPKRQYEEGQVTPAQAMNCKTEEDLWN